MFRTLAILCLVAAPAFGIWQKSLKVRYDKNPLSIGSTSFMEMPQMESEAVEAGWVVMTGPTLPKGYESLITLCPSENDVTLCLMFDENGKVAGVQLAFNPSKFTGQVFDWKVSGFSEWNVTVDDETTTHYATRLYFMSTDFLALDATTRLSNYNDKYTVQGDQLYVTAFNGAIYNISTNMEYLKTGGVYTKEACILGMGNHYYYNMTTSLECTADLVLPWFPLEYADQLVGIGFTVPGTYTIDSDKLNPFEISTEAIIKMTIPTAPDCLTALGASPGVITSHIYFIKYPFMMSCII